jgi:hypothetical protein
MQLQTLTKLALIPLLIVPMGACTTMTASVETSRVACQAFEPITWSTRDTDETVRGVKAHNAVYQELC